MIDELKKEIQDTKYRLNKYLKNCEAQQSNLLKVIKAYKAERDKNHRFEFAAYTGGLVNEGRLPREKQSQVIEFMETLQASQDAGAEFAEEDPDSLERFMKTLQDSQEAGVAFAEAEPNNLKRFKTLLNAILPPRVEFAEVATQDALSPLAGNNGSAEDIAREIRSLRSKLAKEGTTLNASQIMNQISGGRHD